MVSFHDDLSTAVECQSLTAIRGNNYRAQTEMRYVTATFDLYILNIGERVSYVSSSVGRSREVNTVCRKLEHCLIS